MTPAVLVASGTSSTWCWCSGCHTARPERITDMSPPAAHLGAPPASTTIGNHGGPARKHPPRQGARRSQILLWQNQPQDRGEILLFLTTTVGTFPCHILNGLSPNSPTAPSTDYVHTCCHFTELYKHEVQLSPLLHRLRSAGSGR